MDLVNIRKGIMKIKKCQVDGEWKNITDGEIKPGRYVRDNSVWNDAMKAKFYKQYQWAVLEGKIQRILPGEPWIVRSYIPNWSYQEGCDVMKSMELRPGLFKWQELVLNEVNEHIVAGKCWKKGVIAGVGSGKTLVALHLSTIGRTLYICPENAKQDVENIAKDWGFAIPTFTTPESSKKVKGDFEVVIFDECLKGKNPGTERSQAVKKLMSNAKVAIAMTGTPISAMDISDLRWLNVFEKLIPTSEECIKGMFGIHPKWVQHEEGGKKWPTLDVEGWKIEEVMKFIAPYLIIADTSECQSIIPETKRTEILLPQPSSFNYVAKGLATSRGSSKKAMQVRTCTSGFIYLDDDTVEWSRENAKIDWLKKYIANHPEPIVVFSAFIAEQEKLAEELKEYKPSIVMGGGESSIEISRFQDGLTNLIIVSAGKATSMNLQRSHTAIFMSNSTKPTDRSQAIGRIARVGQKEIPEIIDVICDGTLDRRCIELLEKHIEISDEIINGELKNG